MKVKIEITKNGICKEYNFDMHEGNTMEELTNHVNDVIVKENSSLVIKNEDATIFLTHDYLKDALVFLSTAE